MSSEDEIDEPTSLLEFANRLGRPAGARLVVYIQLFALIPCVLIGRCELWCYAELLETGIIGMLFFPRWRSLFPGRRSSFLSRW